MAASGDVIDLDVIEGHKENIQSLPGGRSAKKLAELYSPSPLDKLSTPTPMPSDTRNVNDCIRAEYEAEVGNMSKSDDPLDVFDRYVRWTLDAYPSAQATPQSQLQTLLERATRAFVSSAQYKNDPRYLKLWVHYIHLFLDAPREAYTFLSRHGIGEGLALFYEEYAAWLEGAGRWPQADEVYKMGLEREARPVQRLLRKFNEFEARRAQQPAAAAVTVPSSPALPTARPALAAKTDPFGSSSRPADPQAPRQGGGIGAAAPRPAKPKLAVFSDADADAKPSALSSRGEGSKGWDTIGSLAHRKKENTQSPKPWVGEKLRAGGRRSAAPKMTVFRDAMQSLAQISNVVVPSKNQVTVHPQTGRKERILVDLAAIYPTPEEPGTELSFEEIMAANRGWLDCKWDDGESAGEKAVPGLHRQVEETGNGVVVGTLAVGTEDGGIYDENGAIMVPPREPRAGMKKVMEVNETQIIKAKLDSPSGPKLRKKTASEPTMTLHTKAATDDIYEIFNAPLKAGARDEAESADEDDYETDGDYTTDAESTGTATRHVDAASEHGHDGTCDAKSVSEWCDLSTRRHIPSMDAAEERERERERQAEEQDEPGGGETQTAGLDRTSATGPEPEQSGPVTGDSSPEKGEDEGPETPGADGETSPPRTRTVFVPPPPEDCDAPTRPYRDPAEAANNRLPFMTPITERTECSLDVDVEPCKTPCRRDDASSPATPGPGPLSVGALSSPLREIADDGAAEPGPEPGAAAPPAAKAAAAAAARPAEGPIIKDKQCNPVDDAIRHEILGHAQPPLASLASFHDHGHARSGRGGEMRKFAKAASRAERAAAPVPETVVLQFPETAAAYRLKRELGAGAFAPVYLVENSAPEPDDDEEPDDEEPDDDGQGASAVRRRRRLEAIKAESPATAWEFYMMRVAHGRVGAGHRAAASLSYAHELHLYRDEAFLVLPYHAHGTLLDAVNAFRAEPGGVMDELLAMVFAVELLRTVEALHARGVVHGDVKADNCLLRLGLDQPLATPWRADGGGGWASRGLVLVDFGRAIDMRAFGPDVEFVADWKTSAHDCAEMREGRPWTWQIDYHGLAGTLHCLLFGKYMDTARCDDDGALGRAARRYRIRETLKRYWQTHLWADCFDLLLNPVRFVDAEDGARMPVLRSMRRVRERFEAWLEANGERGVGLRSLMAKLEAHARSRR